MSRLQTKRRTFLSALAGIPGLRLLVGGPGAARPGSLARPGRDPGTGRPFVHQCGRHLHCPDRIADAARGRGRDAGRRTQVCPARRPARRRGQADRRAAALSRGSGDLRLCLGALAGHGGLRRRQGPRADPPPAGYTGIEERSPRAEDPPRRLRPRHPQRGRDDDRSRDPRGAGDSNQRRGPQ